MFIAYYLMKYYDEWGKYFFGEGIIIDWDELF